MTDNNIFPSAYDTNEEFERYLGETSYYKSLQDAVLKIVKMKNPDSILELGSGSGETSLRIAREYEGCTINAIDNRQSVVDIARKSNTYENVSFECEEMVSYVKERDKIPEMVILLYAFHHIPDPRENKVEFLEYCYESLPDGGIVCIAEAFLPSERFDHIYGSTREVWATRELESYSSTFWSELNGLDNDSISKAKKIGEYARKHESESGENVAEREIEYLVTRLWLESKAEEIGFDVILSEPVNSIQDGVVVLQK